MKRNLVRLLPLTLLLISFDDEATSSPAYAYPVVDTGQVRAYSEKGETGFPEPGKPFFGQDSHFAGNVPAFRDNGDGTVSDLVTGLMWQKDPGAKMGLSAALKGASACRLAGHRDWRLPTVKELYSLILFSGTDPDPKSSGTEGLKPFIDDKVFAFEYGDPEKGERIIDSQFATATKYVSTTMRNDETVFGVNFADGRIKGYPVKDPRRGEEKTFFVLYVRGNPQYGKNDFNDNGDGTITDRATGLVWMKQDSGHLKAGRGKDGALNWEEALGWADALEFAGQDDWRLPNAKELQSIVDYTRSPATSGSAAIAPVFEVSEIRNEAGKADYPFYWSGTTHARAGGGRGESCAVYVAFGTSPGWMSDRRSDSRKLLDVHGAGSQRSDPKSGDPGRFPQGRGPQGDVIRIFNHVRCVRGGVASPVTEGPPPEKDGLSKEGKVSPTNPFMRREDRDGDGKVTESEFRGPKNHFNRLDKNGDGYITEDEAPSGRPDRQGDR